MKSIKAYYNVSIKRKKMQKFMNDNMKLSEEEYNRDNILDSNKVYDKFVVGSDMVLDLEINGNDMTYYNN
jgi:hypothetical protein